MNMLDRWKYALNVIGDQLLLLQLPPSSQGQLEHGQNT